MVRQTSKDAYLTIKETGLLSERRWMVYHILYNHGPLTGNEVYQRLKTEFGIKFGNAPSIVSRLGELRDLGVVSEYGKTICSVTGMRVIRWDVTSNLPTKWDRPKRIKCKTCDGKGYLKEQQARLF